MDIWLHGITTAVPENVYSQKESAESIADWTTNAHDRRLGTIAHKVSGIERRHSVLASLNEGFFHRDASGNMFEPTTGERNAIFRKTSIPLACDLVDRLFKEQAINRSSVTHVITVSCTGFFNPGLEAKKLLIFGPYLSSNSVSSIK